MRYAILFLLLFTAGCGALKDRTGQFVTEAVVDHIAEAVDLKLERRGLSREKLVNIADLNNDGKVDMAEVMRTAKLAAGELLNAQASSWERRQREDWEKAQKKFVTFDDQTTVKGKLQDFWNYLLATIGALVATVISYLTKQVFSAKSDGKRDTEIAKGAARMDALERLTGRDLNHDGFIGTNGTPVPTPEVEA